MQYTKTIDMTTSFYRKHNSDYFKGKFGTVLVDQKNMGGLEIKAGETIRFRGKHGRGGFCISNKYGIQINGVPPHQVDLSETSIF